MVNAVNCYMNQYGVTKQEAVKELHKMVTEADKALNEEILTTKCLSPCLLNAAMGLAKMIAICYNGYEGYTHPEEKIKKYMNLIFVDQIRL